MEEEGARSKRKEEGGRRREREGEGACTTRVDSPCKFTIKREQADRKEFFQLISSELTK